MTTPTEPEGWEAAWDKWPDRAYCRSPKAAFRAGFVAAPPAPAEAAASEGTLRRALREVRSVAQQAEIYHNKLGASTTFARIADIALAALAAIPSPTEPAGRPEQPDGDPGWSVSTPQEGAGAAVSPLTLDEAYRRASEARRVYEEMAGITQVGARMQGSWTDAEVERAARAVWSHCVCHEVDDDEWATMREPEIAAFRVGLAALTALEKLP